MFGSTTQSIIDVNGNHQIQPFETIFVPVSKLPNLTQPSRVFVNSTPGENGKKGVVVGLGIGLGVCGILLVFVCGLFGYRENTWKKRKGVVKKGGEGEKMVRGGKALDVKFVADMSDCLDKCKVFGIEELRQATDGFDER
ncbi:unnamed protein product [Camellia sinensis]